LRIKTILEKEKNDKISKEAHRGTEGTTKKIKGFGVKYSVRPEKNSGGFSRDYGTK